LLCWTLLYTGRRIGDLLNPNTKLRNLNLPPIVVEKFKAMPPRPSRKAGMSQKGAGVPFLERDPDERIFRFHQGGYLRKLLAQAMANAGLSFPKRERGFHLFCHSYATWCIRGGMDNHALARTGRWKDPRSAAPYIHNLVSDEAKRAAMLLPTPNWEQSGGKASK